VAWRRCYVRRLYTLEAFAETAESGALHVGGDVGVGIHSVRNLGVAEDLLDDLGILSLLQHKRSEGMSKIVETGFSGNPAASRRGL
jgi:hypothetical protein